MKTFATIVVSTLLLLAYAPAFAHGSGHSGMNGNNNTQYTMKTPTPNATPIPTQTGNNTTKTTTSNGHLSFGQKLFLRNEERVLKFEINQLRAEVARLQGLFGLNSPKTQAVQNQLIRDGAKLLQIETKLGQVVIL